MSIAVKDATGAPVAIASEANLSANTITPHSAPEIGGSVVSATNPMPCADANNAAFQGVVPITPGAPVTAGRSLGFVVATAGSVTLTLADGSTISLSLVASPQFQTLPFGVTNVALGTAAGSFWNLK